MDWFRMYAEARTDRKLAALADDEHRVWFDLLCFAAGNDGDRRGTFDLSDKALLAVEVARADEELLDRTLDKLQRLRIIHCDEQVGTFCSFLKRQYDKPSDTPERVAERVRAYRKRQSNAINMEGTRVKRDVTPSNALYTDTESDSESDPTTPPRVAPDAVAPDAPLAPAPLARVRSVPKPESAPLHRELWDAFDGVFGPARGKTESQRRGEACKRAREAHASPDEIQVAAQHWPNVMGDATMTELGIVANLGKLLHGPQVNGRSAGTVMKHQQTLTEAALISRRETAADVLARRRTQQRQDMPHAS